jgi:hypothetical protein
VRRGGEKGKTCSEQGEGWAREEGGSLGPSLEVGGELELAMVRERGGQGDRVSFDSS